MVGTAASTTSSPGSSAPELTPAGSTAAARSTSATPNDYRVPDQAYLRDEPAAVFNPAAAVVVESVSPGDETRAELEFYFRHGVEEVVIVDPASRSVEIYARGAGAFVLVDRSALLDIGAIELGAVLDWPA